MNSETPFMDWLKEKNLERESKLAKLFESSELHEKIDRLIPEPLIPEVEGKPIENFQASWKEGEQIGRASCRERV